MQLAMIYFARVAFFSLATHEFRKWLSIKDIFQFKSWRLIFLAPESKQLISYPLFGSQWSWVGSFRKIRFRMRERAEANRPMRSSTVRFVGDDSRRASQFNQKRVATCF